MLYPTIEEAFDILENDSGRRDVDLIKQTMDFYKNELPQIEKALAQLSQGPTDEGFSELDIFCIGDVEEQMRLVKKFPNLQLAGDFLSDAFGF